MNIYEKLSNARASFHAQKLKKTGHNKFAGYYYFELADFVEAAMNALADQKLFAYISYGKEEASITVKEFDGDGEVKITSPMSTAALKGCHEVQNLGAVETYIRRYLWVTLMEVIENDPLEPTVGQSDTQATKSYSKPATKSYDDNPF